MHICTFTSTCAHYVQLAPCTVYIVVNVYTVCLRPYWPTSSTQQCLITCWSPRGCPSVFTPTCPVGSTSRLWMCTRLSLTALEPRALLRGQCMYYSIHLGPMDPLTYNVAQLVLVKLDYRLCDQLLTSTPYITSDCAMYMYIQQQSDMSSVKVICFIA